VCDGVRFECRRDSDDVGVSEDHVGQQAFDGFGVVEPPSDRGSDDAGGHLDRAGTRRDGVRARVRQRRERLAGMQLDYLLGTPQDEHQVGCQHAYRSQQDPSAESTGDARAQESMQRHRF
jgi:hypothetical protein